jgi:transcriptional regulator with XRE-family HTH domain
MTQAELSEKADISISQISLFENNKSTPSLPNLWKIAQAIGCRVDSLYKIIK